jgi:hypothetical protein
MSFSSIIVKLVIQYQKDKYGFEFTVDDFKSKPWTETVGLYFDALAYYKMDNWYYDLSEVEQPTEGMYVSIRKDKLVQRYRYDNGRWINTGDFDESVYK